MKLLTLLICTVAFISCVQKKQSKSEAILIFEESMEICELALLNKMAYDLDLFLDTLYDSQHETSKYKRFLMDLSDNRKVMNWEIDKKRIQKNGCISNLFPKYDTLYPDSFIVENNHITPFFGNNEEYIFPDTRIEKGTNIDSLKQVLTEDCAIVFLKEEGQFYSALKIVSDIDNLVEEYLLYRDNNEDNNLRIIAKGLLSTYSVDSEYFSKRILIMHLYPSEKTDK